MPSVRARRRSVATDVLPSPTAAGSSGSAAEAQPSPRKLGVTRGAAAASEDALAPKVLHPFDGLRPPRLVGYSEVPKFLQFNCYVHGGYRPYPMTLSQALFSSVGYFHNETLNIATHLLPALLCGYFAVKTFYMEGIGATPEGQPSGSAPVYLHHAVVALADTVSAACMLLSFVYHTWMNSVRDARAYERLMAIDVWGIWVVNAGAALILTYLLFPCGPWYLRSTLIGVPVIGSFLWLLFVANTPARRALAFFITWLVRFFTVAVTIFPFMRGLLSLTPPAEQFIHWSAVGGALHLLAELMPPTGATINVIQVPERWYPGRFDYFNSHTLMHVLVAAGMVVQHFLGASRAANIDHFWLTNDAEMAGAYHCVEADQAWIAAAWRSIVGG